MWIYGRNPVLEALRAGRARRVLVARRVEGWLLKELERLGAPYTLVPRIELDTLLRTTHHQGIAAEVQERLERMTVVGSAQGLVEVEANGHGKILALRLKPEALKAFQDDPEGLEDLLLVAIQDAQTKAHELSEKEMAKELGGVGQMLGKLF